MSGGIQRRFSITKSLATENTLVLENGGISNGSSRQEVIKAETLAESLKAAKVDAIHLASSDLALGEATLANFNRLSGEKLISTETLNLAGSIIAETATKGPFLIGTAESSKRITSLAAIESLIRQAEQLKKIPILMASFNEKDAESIAISYPQLKLIIFRLPGNPPMEPRRVGQTLLVTPEKKGSMS